MCLANQVSLAIYLAGNRYNTTLSLRSVYVDLKACRIIFTDNKHIPKDLFSDGSHLRSSMTSLKDQ